MWGGEELITQCNNARDNLCGIIGSSDNADMQKKAGRFLEFSTKYLSNASLTNNRDLELFRDNVSNAIGAINKIHDKQIRQKHYFTLEILNNLERSLKGKKSLTFALKDGRIASNLGSGMGL